jgi:hypothetical protein
LTKSTNHEALRYVSDYVGFNPSTQRHYRRFLLFI